MHLFFKIFLYITSFFQMMIYLVNNNNIYVVDNGEPVCFFVKLELRIAAYFVLLELQLLPTGFGSPYGRRRLHSVLTQMEVGSRWMRLVGIRDQMGNHSLVSRSSSVSALTRPVLFPFLKPRYITLSPQRRLFSTSSCSATIHIVSADGEDGSDMCSGEIQTD